MNVKMIFVLLSLSLLISCSEETKEEPTVSEKIVENEPEPEPEPEPEFPKYSSVLEMLQSSGDYRQDEGTLKILSSEDELLHIQLSKWVFEGDVEDTITRQVKRNIVYVSFQTFAKTDIDELTITSVPLRMKDFETQDRYLEESKKTITIDRESANEILEKYLNTTSFQDLYELDSSGQIWLPNNNFEELRFDKLSAVFSDFENL